MLKSVCATLLLLAVGSANATILQITGTSESVGQLGYFVVDDAVLVVDSTLVASQFVSYSFVDPSSGIILDPSTVDGDTGFTRFGLESGEWTVIGGGGDSLTDTDLSHGLWIAGTNLVSFNSSAPPSYSDVSWSTEALVSEPATLAIFGIGLLAMGPRRRRWHSNPHTAARINRIVLFKVSSRQQFDAPLPESH